jgi:hypothetical protein
MRVSTRTGAWCGVVGGRVHAVRSLPLLDEPLTDVPRDEGTDDRCYKYIRHRRRDDTL